MKNNALWALTTYYNPVGYRRRLTNYKSFRKELKVPLVTVELSFSGDFELTTIDSDILIQIKGDSVLWQKERLLNLALSYVPKNIPYITWLDCDIIFENSNWINDTIDALTHYPIVQNYSSFYDLDKDAEIPNAKYNSLLQSPSGFSMAYLNRNKEFNEEFFKPQSTLKMRRNLFGLAWAARREIVDEFGIYDAMVVGSGDRGFGCAAWGKFDEFIIAMKLNEHRSMHYLAWAIPFYNKILGNVGFVDATLFHLWHGDIKERKYLERHSEFSGLDFNPFTDIKINDNESWSWSNEKAEIATYLKTYFSSRNEDGNP